MIRIGVIGFGYWGPNIVRSFQGLCEGAVVAVCDLNPNALQRARQAFPSLKHTNDPSQLIESAEIDAVAVITPVWTHFDLAKKVLTNGKHLFIEKPFTSTSAQAEELIELAEKKHLKIMVDHTFLFTGAVRKIRQLVDDDVLGRLYYYDPTRVNLGLFQHDINVIWDLAPHDLSIMDFLVKHRPQAISATGAKHLNALEDTAYITVYFPDDFIAHINVNWLSPVKIRTTLLGGEKQMLVWNDLEADEKIKVYDRGVQVTSGHGVYELLVSYRSGDMWSPKLDPSEALKLESAHFVDCILNDKAPLSDGAAGLRVVRMLEATDRSVAQRGRLVEL
jgi:predicted dehydrogenase